jgi:uncharacterized protein with PIN domain
MVEVNAKTLVDYFITMLKTKSMDKLTKKIHENTVEALQKQVPKRPIQQSTWKACPSCKQGIGVTDKTPNPRAIEYCFHCGQRLGWNLCPECGGDMLHLDNGNYPEYYEEWLECEKCGFVCDV